MTKLTDHPHDPLQFLNQLRQTLAAPKLAVGLLIGAGCPCSIKGGDEKTGPLIPDVTGLTNKVSLAIKGSDHKSSFEKLLAVLKEDGEDEPNIETILGRIRALNDVAGKDKARGLSADELSKLDKKICVAITKFVDREAPTDGTPYRSLARFVESRARPATELFTTNYDLLLEQALEAQRVPYFDGFVGGVKPFFDQRAIDDDLVPERWCRLWKLHGSINWRSNKDGIFRSRRVEDGDEQLIHPSHRKYDESRRMPYFVMIDRLRSFVRNGHQPAALVVIGYSFSDQHINEAIMEGLRSNPSAVCYGLQFDQLDKYQKGKKLALEIPNFSLLARDAAVMRRRVGPWLARPAIEESTILSAFNFEKEADGDHPRPCSCVLGDFERLGAFLEKFVVAAELS